MTFPHDQIRDDYRSQDHAPLTILLVAAIMILAALIAMIVVF